MRTVVIEDAAYVVTVDDADTVLTDTTVVVEDGVVTGIGDERIAPPPRHPTAAATPDETTVVDGRGRLVMPGLVNLHTHLPMTLLRGLAEDVDLQGFLTRVWAAEGAVMDPDTVELGATLGALESLLGGCTTQLDMYFHHEAAHRGARRRRQPARHRPGLHGRPRPRRPRLGRAPRPAARLARGDARPRRTRGAGGRDAARHVHVLARAPRRGRRDPARELRARSSPTSRRRWPCSRPTSRRTRPRTPTSARGTGARRRRSSSRPAGWPATCRSSRATACTSPPTTAALLVAAGAAVAHCAGSNQKLASGALHWDELRSAGVRLGIGTDGCSSSNDLDMWQAMRQAALLARLTSGRPDVASAHEVVRAATIDGARALGLGGLIGSVEVGKRADLLLLDLDRPHLTPVHDVHALLVFAAGRADVTDVLVDGELVVRDGASTRLDTRDLLARARERGALARAAAEAS